MFFLFFRVTYHTGRDQMAPLSIFFRHRETSFGIFFAKGPPSNFCCFASEWLLENPKRSPFQFFGIVRLFSKIFSPQMVPFQFLRYITTDWVFKNPKGSPFNCDKNIVNLESVPLLARVPKPHSVHFFCLFDFRVL